MPKISEEIIYNKKVNKEFYVDMAYSRDKSKCITYDNKLIILLKLMTLFYGINEVHKYVN